MLHAPFPWSYPAFFMSQPRRVVITGMGVITPNGLDVPTFWDNMVHGKSGIGPITHFDVSAYKCRIAGEVRDFQPLEHFKTPKDVNRTDRFTHLAVAAAKAAMADAGLRRRGRRSGAFRRA